MPVQSATLQDPSPAAAAPQPALATKVEPRLVVVTHHGEPLAVSNCVVRLEHPDLADALYLPMADVVPGRLTPSGRVERCPLRGEVRYWTVSVGGEEVVDGAFSLVEPLAVCGRLADRVAFDPARIDEVSMIDACA